MAIMTTEDYAKAPYARIVIPDERGEFYAEVLEFPGCYAEGKTVHEAFSNLEHAAKSWIEAAEEAGQEIPEPSTNAGFGGKVALRLPRSLHKQAVRMAERDGTSLNQFLVMSIAGRVGSEDFYTKLVNRLESRFLAVAANVMTRMVINYYLQQPGARLETLNDKLLQTANTRAKQEVVTADGRS